jgi:hypothetical protein
MTTRELFQKLRESPGMYLDRPSARTLQAFLSGYELACQDSDPDFLLFSSEFSNWMRKRYNIHSSQHWTKIIEFYSTTESEEMTLFWKRFDEFEARPKRKKRPAAPESTSV